MFAADVVLAAHRARRKEIRATLHKLLDTAICLGRRMNDQAEIDELLRELMLYTKEGAR